MARVKGPNRSAGAARGEAETDGSRAAGTGGAIRFGARLCRPLVEGGAAAWTFLVLPTEASTRLRSRGQVAVEGTLNGAPFAATLEPDGRGGHWMKVEKKLREAAGARPGDTVALEVSPAAEEPEPKVPADLRSALAAAAPGKPGKMGAREAWADITPAARRDFVHWIVSAKQEAMRAKRIATACDMLAKGKRRPCCFDRSGMYDKSLACPVEAE